jgi:two-component system sensor histidine kinase UhpB
MSRCSHLLAFSLHGLRAQVILWTVLPLTILLIVFSISGINSHQQSMQALATEENTRLVLALAELIAVQRENYALNHQVAIDQVPLQALDLERMLNINHPNAVNTIVLFNREGEVLFGRGNFPDAAALHDWPGVAEIMTGTSGVLFTSHTMHGDVVAFAPVPDTDWGLIIREPWHSLTDPLIRFEQVMPFILFIATATSFLTLFFGLRYVVQPLRELGQRASLIGQNEFQSIARPIGGVKEIEDLRVMLHEMVQRVKGYQAALEDYARALTQAQEEERARLARELHDETVQTLIALGHKTQMVQRHLSRDPDQVEQRVSELREMIAQSIEEIRRFSRALHPHYLDELGLVPALETLAGEAGAAFRVSGSPSRLESEKELTLYRIAQEALNNARRHAHAHSIQVELQFEPAAVQLRVCDDGQGFEVPSYLNLNDLTRTGHFGLIGMRERAQLVNGELKIESSNGKGTTVTLSITKT